MSDVATTGLLWADNGNVVVHGAVSGTGTALISGSATLEFGAASSANTSFDAGASGTLILDDAFHFGGTLSGLAAGDTLDLADVAATATVSFTANADASGGTLTVTDGTQTATIVLIGHYDPSGFHQGADAGSHLAITYSDPIPIV